MDANQINKFTNDFFMMNPFFIIERGINVNILSWRPTLTKIRVKSKINLCLLFKKVRKKMNKFVKIIES